MSPLGPCPVSILAVFNVSRLTYSDHSRAILMVLSPPFFTYSPQVILSSQKNPSIFNEKLGSSREVKCPKCHGPFQVPLKGAEDLPTNYFTASAVSAANASIRLIPIMPSVSCVRRKRPPSRVPTAPSFSATPAKRFTRS